MSLLLLRLRLLLIKVIDWYKPPLLIAPSMKIILKNSGTIAVACPFHIKGFTRMLGINVTFVINNELLVAIAIKGPETELIHAQERVNLCVCVCVCVNNKKNTYLPLHHSVLKHH